ncbi:DinB family protein [Pseudalkalibacillus caeni]|uniref:DUF664 domain-containing protein n=1 Tax=Exobacillus caeni TaxID=2574798 RepID=A0A5R9F5Q6_9BACL|nr:DinB family protein [Pseudalkalibacillus caeni]TLS37819.1 DUF664 domain-containing protein [Pseudalkalibacillus caeni]
MEERTLGNYDIHDAAHLLKGLKETREKLLEVISDIDTDDLHYKHSGLPSIGGYLLHIAQIELWWAKTVLLEQNLSESDKEHFFFNEDQKITAPEDKELSWFQARLAEARALTRGYYNQLSDVDFRNPTKRAILEGKEVFCSPEWVIYHLIDHESYHRGQIGMLLKLIAGKREKWDHFNTPYLSL